jgi:hypothetical protein
LQFSTSDRAVRAGERVAATKLGALVLEAISGDEYATPNVVARLGEVPDEAVDALPAEASRQLRSSSARQLSKLSIS